MDADVGIIGVGTIGSLLAWRLAERGVDTIGFERFSPGHDRGAAGGETRLFRLAYAEGGEYLPLLTRALPLWRELESASGLPIFDQCGGLSIGRRDQPVMDIITRTGEAAGVTVEVLDRARMSERFPQHALDEDEYAIFDPAAGQLRADQAVLAAANLAQTAGATVESGCQVLQILDRDDHVEIVTDSRPYRVRETVVCAGAWSRRFLPLPLAEAVEPRRVALTWFAPHDPAAYQPADFPVFVRVSEDRLMYGGPPVDGVHVKIGGIRPPRPLDDPDQRNRTLDDDELAETVSTIRRYFPGLNPYPVRADAYPDLFADEHRPIIGRTDRRVTVAVAGSGRTFKFAPAVADLLADQLTLRDQALHNDILSRFAPSNSSEHQLSRR